jgi:hypothetical protein
MSWRWPHQYAVSGGGEFPRDMLRYDEADFLSRADETVAEQTTRRTIKIAGEVEPTIRRWESFGWNVSAIEPLTAMRTIKTANGKD